MYKSFSVKNFRGFKELEFNGLDHINIIAGRNNTGKTALLEALFLHCGAINPSLSLRVNAFRGMERISVVGDPTAELPWNSLFYNFDINAPINLIGIDRNDKKRVVALYSEKLKSVTLPVGIEQPALIPDALSLEYKDDKGKTYKVQMRFEQRGPVMEPVLPVPFPTSFVAARRALGPVEDATRYGNLEIQKKEGILVETLKCLEPRLSRLAVIVINGEPTIHGDIGTGRLIPLPLMGEGKVRLASIVLAITTSQDGVVLIDEVENGLHHSIMVDIWKGIGRVATQFFTQMFATTHSLECIQSAHQAFRGSAAYDLRVHRLDRNESKTSVATYDQETLEAAIQSGLEIR